MAPAKRKSLPPRASDIFVNRTTPLKVFEDAAFSIPNDGSILRVFYGVGGQGKTALCRKLFNSVSSDSDPSFKFLKRALVDLHKRPKTDADLLLVWIRNEFAKEGVAFPAFDITLALTWEASRGEEAFPTLVNAWLSKSADTLSEAAPEIVQSVREALEQSVETIPLLGKLATKGSKWLMDKSKHAYLHRSREHLAELYLDGELKQPYEISKLLPWMLAQDFNYYLEHHADDRFVLFMDEYERVFPEGGVGARWQENLFDQHMRLLVQETNGLLAVFFSRRKLPWNEHPDWRDDLKNTQHLIGGLAKSDADEWLQKVPITDEVVRAAIVEGSREDASTDAPIYPLMLDLQIEHWRELTAQGAKINPETFHVSATTFEGRCIELVRRLLRDYGSALEFTLEHLAVANRFDRAAFEYVVTHFGTALPLDIFEQLTDFSFISEGDDDFLVMHRAVAETICTIRGEEKLKVSAKALLEHYEGRAAVPSSRDVTDNIVSMLLEAAHLRQKLNVEGYVEWLSKAIEPIKLSARYAVVEQVWREALFFTQEILGEEHPSTATSYNNVAYNLNAQGRLQEAEPLFRKALEICERVLGEEHPSTATSYNNVASNLNAQGRLQEAEPLYRKALEICERVLGEEHPSTATSYNNVASNLNAQGRLQEAEPLFRKALEICERVLGEEHPSTATSYNNVASNLNAQGRLQEAEPLYRKALEIRERVLGEEHPSTATSYNNVASNLNAQGRLQEAEPLYRKALENRERVLGEEHPSTATSYNNVAYNLNAQGRLQEAEPLYRKALEICERVLGEEHPSTATSYNNVASNLNAQGRLQEAEPLYRKALEICERVLGEEHPTTNILRSNLEIFLANLIGE